MEHEIAVVVWNEFIAQTINKGCNFSFNDLEKRIKETINQALSQHDVILPLPNKCTCWGGNIDCFSGNCTVCGNRKGNGI